MSVIDSLLLRSVVIFLTLGSAAGLLAGALLILRPEWLMRLGKFTNRWVSTRKLDRALETPINVDHWLYRNSRVTGTLTLAGSIYIIYFIIVSLDRLHSLAGLFKNNIVPPALMDALLDALVLTLLAGAVAALIISLFLLFRPSLLRGLEQNANKTTSLRRALKPLEVSRSAVDDYVFRHVRMVGALLLLGSLYVLVGLVAWLR